MRDNNVNSAGSIGDGDDDDDDLADPQQPPQKIIPESSDEEYFPSPYVFNNSRGGVGNNFNPTPADLSSDDDEYDEFIALRRRLLEANRKRLAQRAADKSKSPELRGAVVNDSDDNSKEKMLQIVETPLKRKRGRPPKDAYNLKCDFKGNVLL